MNLRDPNVQKILIGAVLLIALSYVYFGTSLLPFCYQVRKAEIAELERGAVAEKSDVAFGVLEAGVLFIVERAVGGGFVDVGVDDGREGVLESVLRGLEGLASAQRLFSDPFVDKNVGIDRHTDGQDDAGNTG